jgi:hypothetical protein
MTQPPNPSSLKQVRLAQLRARALRGGIGKAALGSVFLVGALAYARAPDHGSQQSRVWMSLLLVMSAFNVGLGLRTIARVRRRSARLWIAATAAWAILSTTVVAFLVRS